MNTPIYVSQYPEKDIEYQASFPTNPYQKVRLKLAGFLIRLGLKLQIRNGTVKITTGYSDAM